MSFYSPLLVILSIRLGYFHLMSHVEILHPYVFLVTKQYFNYLKGLIRSWRISAISVATRDGFKAVGCNRGEQFNTEYTVYGFCVCGNDHSGRGGS